MRQPSNVKQHEVFVQHQHSSVDHCWLIILGNACFMTTSCGRDGLKNVWDHIIAQFKQVPFQVIISISFSWAMGPNTTSSCAVQCTYWGGHIYIYIYSTCHETYSLIFELESIRLNTYQYNSSGNLICIWTSKAYYQIMSQVETGRGPRSGILSEATHTGYPFPWLLVKQALPNNPAHNKRKK